MLIGVVYFSDIQFLYILFRVYFYYFTIRANFSMFVNFELGLNVTQCLSVIRVAWDVRLPSTYYRTLRVY